MKFVRVLLLSMALTGFYGTAQAVPVLQLDLASSVYDTTTQTVVAANGPFSLFAILTPDPRWSPEKVQSLLNQTYYISAAITPQLSPDATGLGSFSMGQTGGPQTTVNVTADMTYGVPPTEGPFSTQDQGYDPGDVNSPMIYPTFFKEFSFHFTPADRAETYDTAVNPGGPYVTPSGGSFYARFDGDTSLLAPGYNVHFDVFSDQLKVCSADWSCWDNDTDFFEPIDHDAETSSTVPEPPVAALVLIGAGLVATLHRRRMATNVA